MMACKQIQGVVGKVIRPGCNSHLPDEAVAPQGVGCFQKTDLFPLGHAREVAAVKGKFHGLAFALSLACIGGDGSAQVVFV